MDSFSDLFKKENQGQVILCVLFIVYLIMGYKTPSSLATLIDNIYGKIIIVVISLILFANSNPVLGILGFIVAFDLIRRSSMSNGTAGLAQYGPTEQKKSSNLSALNQFPYTLEQEIVKKMAPINKSPDTQSPADYRPILDELYDAAPINYNGVN